MGNSESTTANGDTFRKDSYEKVTKFGFGNDAFNKLSCLFRMLEACLKHPEGEFETQDERFEFYAGKSMKTLFGSPFGTTSFFWIHLRNVIRFMLVCEEEEVFVVSKYLKILIFEIIKMHPNFFHMRENVRVNFFENTPSAKHGVISVKPPIWLLEKDVDKCEGEKKACLVCLLKRVASFGPNEDKTSADADAVQSGAADADAD